MGLHGFDRRPLIQDLRDRLIVVLKNRSVTLQLMQLRFVGIQRIDNLVQRRQLPGDRIVAGQAGAKISLGLVAVRLHAIGLRRLHAGDVGLAFQGLAARLDPTVPIEDVRLGKFVKIVGQKYEYFCLVTDVQLDSANADVLQGRETLRRLGWMAERRV